jgi:uncharacterized protein YndB with AHSA1/START domain
MSADSIVIEMVYPYPIEQVWDALTQRDALAAWLMPNDFEPQLGHRFTFRVAPGQAWSGTIDCQVIELTALQRLAFTWRGEGTTFDTLVTFRIQAVEGGTHLRLEHSGFASGGQIGFNIRDMLASGWNSKKLREDLPAYLKAHATH